MEQVLHSAEIRQDGSKWILACGPLLGFVGLF